MCRRVAAQVFVLLEVLYAQGAPNQPHPDTHGRVAAPLRVLSEDIHTQRTPDVASAHARRRHRARVQRLLQAIHQEGGAGEPHAQSHGGAALRLPGVRQELPPQGDHLQDMAEVETFF